MAELQGTRGLTNALLALPNAVEAKALRKSALSGARVVSKAVQLLAPIAAKPVRRRGGGVTQPGTLRRAVVVKFAKEKSGLGKATYIVAVRHGKRFQKGNRDAFYWLWVEQGHAISRVRGQKTGQVPPHPFFVPAYRQTATLARETMKSTLETEVSKLIRGA